MAPLCHKGSSWCLQPDVRDVRCPYLKGKGRMETRGYLVISVTDSKPEHEFRK